MLNLISIKKINAKTIVTTANDTETRNKIPITMMLYLAAIVVGFFISLLLHTHCQNLILVVLVSFPVAIYTLTVMFVLLILNKKTIIDIIKIKNKFILRI